MNILCKIHVRLGVVNQGWEQPVRNGKDIASWQIYT